MQCESLAQAGEDDDQVIDLFVGIRRGDLNPEADFALGTNGNAARVA